MISFLKKFFCKLNTNKTTKEKDNEDYVSFEFLDRESIRDFQNTLLKVSQRWNLHQSLLAF